MKSMYSERKYHMHSLNPKLACGYSRIGNSPFCCIICRITWCGPFNIGLKLGVIKKSNQLNSAIILLGWNFQTLLKRKQPRFEPMNEAYIFKQLKTFLYLGDHLSPLEFWRLLVVTCILWLNIESNWWKQWVMALAGVRWHPPIQNFYKQTKT